MGKTIYSKLLLSHSSGKRFGEWKEHADKLDISIYSESDLELVRQIWERNADQVSDFLLIVLFFHL